MIGTSFGSKETLKRLDQLDDAWWLEALDQAQEKLSINVEFVYRTKADYDDNLPKLATLTDTVLDRSQAVLDWLDEPK